MSLLHCNSHVDARVNVRCPPHRGRYKELPPRDLVDALVEINELHWYWLGDFYEDPFERYAVFRWAPHAEHPANYVVVRLLWTWNHGDLVRRIGRRIMLENNCGLATCIRPSHWTCKTTMPKRYTLEPKQGERMAFSNSPLLPTVHLQHVDSAWSVCGAKTAMAIVPVGEEITCNECVKTWLARGAKLKEL